MTASSKDDGPVIVWLRKELRTSDNPALQAAAETGRPVIPVFIFDPKAGLGGASRWWLHHSLESLCKAFVKLGSPLVSRQGNPADIIPALVEEAGAKAVFWSRAYDRRAIGDQDHVAKWLNDHEIQGKCFKSRLLFEPDAIRNKEGNTYQTFTPFWRACRESEPPPHPKQAPSKLTAPPKAVKSDTLKSWHLLPTKPDWSGRMSEAWRPGETDAADRLEEFLDRRLKTYANARDRPDTEGTSRLSPHLHWGEVSPRQAWHAALHAQAHHGHTLDTGTERFLAELGWREFSYTQLFHHPNLAREPLRPAFRDFPWERDAEALHAWQRGRTGYPLVDAGMRELWATGWMHNRVRMVAASFLIKHLLQPWQDGEAWFWDCLVDADEANNAASWQWVAGCGADAAPYFRIFNPIIQGKKFDPNGDYVRRWIPEIAERPTDKIHEPIDDADGPRLPKGKGATSGKPGSYPPPIVGHDWARNRALAALKQISG